jgi:hypothetical protein
MVEGRKRHILMHYDVLRAPLGFETDHINGNRLDNRRSNLRLVTHQQNQWNRRKKANATSKYIGVTADSGKWRARIHDLSGRLIGLGYYDKEETAARVYDKAALEMRGEYARLNFPPSPGSR